MRLSAPRSRTARAPCRPLRNAPSTILPAATRRATTALDLAPATPNRAASASGGNGPCVRAQRRTMSPQASFTGSRNACGASPGGGDPERVPVASDVLARDEALLPGDGDAHDASDPSPARRAQLSRVGGRSRAHLDLAQREVAERQEQVVHARRRASPGDRAAGGSRRAPRSRRGRGAGAARPRRGARGAGRGRS